MDLAYIVVAGGQGRRFGGDIPKQFVLAEGKPILWHTVRQLSEGGVREIILVMDPSYQEMADGFLRDLPVAIRYVPGGEERMVSVLRGLEATSGTGWAAIHDSVRPMVSPGLLARLEVAAREGEGVCGIIPVLPLADTVKEWDPATRRITHTLDRNSLVRAGTPQLVHIPTYLPLLKEAIATGGIHTDDAGILEAGGFQVAGVPGEEDAFKVTGPDDLERLEAIIRRNHENRNRL